MWKNFYLVPHLVSRDTEIWYLQFKILHRILATNSFLQKIKYVDSNLCCFCNSTEETIEHLLFECYFVKSFWNKVFGWLNLNQPTVTIMNILFGWPVQAKNKILNWFILQAKHYIFMCKNQNVKLNFTAFKAIVQMKFYIESNIARRRNADEYDTTWAEWIQLFES